MGKGGSKVEVDLYYMSIHFGVCAEADAIKRIIIKEKEAWSGYVTSQSAITINKPDLFGGKKKEGGAVGVVHWLPGLSDQVLPDVLATRLGCPSGAECVGFRGLASAFFVGSGGSSGSGLISSLFGGISGSAGFYWAANTPYLPGTWITVERAPKGLDPSIALIARPGTNLYPLETIEGAAGPSSFAFSPDYSFFIMIGSTDVILVDTDTMSVISTAALPAAIGGYVGLRADGMFYAISGFPSQELWLMDTTGGGTLLTTSFESFAEGCRYAGGLCCVYPYGFLSPITMYYDGSGVVSDVTTFIPTHYFTDVSGNAWAVGPVPGEDKIGFRQMPDGTTNLVDIPSTGGANAYGMDNGTNFVVYSGGYLLLVDPALWTATYVLASGSGSEQFAFDSVSPGSATLWLETDEYSTLDLSLIRSVDRSLWSPPSFGASVYDPVNNGIIAFTAFPDLVELLLDRGERDANPAHIIYEALTETDWGMGSPSTLLDLDSFNLAAETLFDEPLGISLLWTRQSSIQDFIQEILNHANAVLFVDPQTGLLTLKLIRGDYDPDDLPTIDPSSANLTNFGRKLWGEIVNEINVTWTNPDNEQDETVTAQDLASIAAQGGIVSDSRNYYGVRYSDLAMRLAMRELRSAGAPLATMQAEVDRSFYFLRPASVLKVDWPEYGLDGIVVRVTSIDYGKPGDPSIKLSLIEDVFGLDAGDYVTPPVSEWEDPSAEPSAMEHQAVFTLPYYFAVNGITSIAGGEYPDVLAGILASTSNADAYNYELAGQVTLADGSTEWDSLATNNILGRATLVADLDAEATSAGIAFTTIVGTTEPVQGGFAIIGDGAEETTEITMVTATGSTYDLERGVLDTVPRAWPAGTEVWFIDESTLFEDPVTRSAGEEVEYRLLTRTSRGLLPLFAAPLLTHTLDDRPWLPSRPANVKAYGVAFSSADDPIDAIARPDPWVTVDWSNRNRLTEDSQVLSWTDATTAPETDQTTTVTVLDGADGTTILATHDALTGTTFDVPDASFGSAPVVILRTSSERIDADGTFESLQYFDHWVTVGFAGGAEGSAGVGVFSPVGAGIVAGALSGSGAGAFSGTGIANSEGAFSGSGTGAMSAVGVDANAFDPATLFAGTQGVFIDLSDAATLFKDQSAEGTFPTPVTTDNDPIGQINDKSGNNNHLKYNTPNSGKRPLYKANSGLPYALFDGVDDFLRATFTFGTTWERISAIRVESFNAIINEQYFGDVIANECVFGSGSNLTMFNGVATGGVQATTAGTDIVLSEQWGSSMQLRIDNGSFNSVGNAAVDPGGITLAGKFNNGDNANMRVYAVFMINRALTSTERAQVVTFMGSKQGRSL